jgi:hypothetical protein
MLDYLRKIQKAEHTRFKHFNTNDSKLSKATKNNNVQLKKQYRESTYNVTLYGIRVTFLSPGLT